VQWWRTLHQPSTVFNVSPGGAPKPAMPAELLVPLLLGVAVATLLYAFLLLYRLRVEQAEDALARRLAER
jgi:hypothetical protein